MRRLLSWRKAEVVKARSVDSVVLPIALKDKIVDDIGESVRVSNSESHEMDGHPGPR